MDRNIQPAESETLQEFAKLRKLRGLEDVLQSLGQPQTKRAVWSLPIDEILRLERQAAKTRWKPQRSLASYWRIDARAVWPQAHRALEQLNDLHEVDFSYKELAASNPNAAGVAYGDDPLFWKQGYLAGAPVGIDARAAWQLGANGSGVAFADLEMGWYLDHEDLQSPKPVVIGKNFAKGSDHGTSVLGIVLCNDNNLGIVGIAPGVSSVQLVSCYHAAENTAEDVACAIGAAIPLLKAGDVLLLEVQRGASNKPTEVDDLDFDAIRLAVSKDIVVIEPAGNGGLNLDSVSNTKGDRRLNNSPNSDSGAIMVGACRQIVEYNWELGEKEGRHSRLPSSNYGSRVNCYAWGEGIMTTTATYGEPETEDDFASRYSNKFGGTSGASAIIAGAALLLQSLYQSNNGGKRLLNVSDPAENMRAILSAPDTGTKQKIAPTPSSAIDHIGVMPDLKKIISKCGLVKEPKA